MICMVFKTIVLMVKISFTTSMEIDVTLNFLLELDKLVQLLESPVYSCMKIVGHNRMARQNIHKISSKYVSLCRYQIATFGAHALPKSIQMSVWRAHDDTSEVVICFTNSSKLPSLYILVIIMISFSKFE